MDPRKQRIYAKITKSITTRRQKTQARIVVLEETVRALDRERELLLERADYILATFGNLPLPRRLTLEEACEYVERENVEEIMDILGYSKVCAYKGSTTVVSFSKVL